MRKASPLFSCLLLVAACGGTQADAPSTDDTTAAASSALTADDAAPGDECPRRSEGECPNAAGGHGPHGDGHGPHGDGHGPHGDGHGPHGDGPTPHWEGGGPDAEGRHHHAFDDPERWAARWDNAERDAWQQPEQVVEWMAIEPGMVAADIGTGTGYFMPHLSAAVGEEGEVHCLDVEPAMVDYVTQRIADAGAGNAVARQVGYDDPGLDAGAFDRVLVVNTWHHIGDRVAYAGRVREGLSAEGTVTIVEYDMEAQPGPPMEMRMTPEEVIAEFDAAGFDAELVGTLPRQYVVRAVPRSESQGE